MCKYHTTLNKGNRDIVCYYVVDAKKMRTIVPGYCLEFERGKRVCR